jgi:hypothetical protein
VFEGVAQKIPWCPQPTCLPTGITLVNFYVSAPCLDYCPYTLSSIARRAAKEQLEQRAALCQIAVLLDPAGLGHNDSSAVFSQKVGRILEEEAEGLVSRGWLALHSSLTSGISARGLV